MKSEKAMTITSLIVYLFAMLIIVSIITVLTGYFYENFDMIETKEDFNFKYTKVVGYFAKEINLEQNEVIDVTIIHEGEDGEQVRIEFLSGNQYTYIPSNKSLYVGKYKICDGIDNIEFDFQDEETKQSIEIILSQGNEEKNIKYTLIKN